MSINDELYREVILDHAQSPRHRGLIANADLVVEGVNPLCGDELKLSIRREDGRLVEIGIQGGGCSISLASASMLAEAVEGKTVEEIDAIIERVKAMLTGKEHEPMDEDEDLAALEGIRKYPVRVKCAMLAWTTLQEALKQSKEGQ